MTRLGLRPAFWLALGLALFPGAAGLSAALEFEATELLVKRATPGEKTISTEFRFKNTGSEPVTITDVHSGCGCTVPKLPAEAIGPGKSGVIPVNYATGERQGRQTQILRLKTSDGQDVALRLVVDLPVRVTFAPRMLLFTTGETAAKVSSVTFGDDTPVTLLSVESTSPDFALAEPARLEGDVVKISIRFTGAADKDARGTVTIRSKGKSGLEHTDLLYVRHRP